MENGTKAVILGVSLFLTLLIISTVLLITNLSVSQTRDSKNEIRDMSKTIETQLITQYDNTIVTGQDIVTAIDLYNEQLNFNIIVRDGIFIPVSGTSLTKQNAWKVKNSNVGGISVILSSGYILQYFPLKNTNSTWIYITYNEGDDMCLENNNELKGKVDLDSRYNSKLIRANSFDAEGLYSTNNISGIMFEII